MSGDLQDPRLGIIASLDLMASRVEFHDSPIVLLCGGPVPVKERAEDADPPLRSLRHAITRHGSSKYELFLPEEIKSWLEDGIYGNLMEFERDLASVCSLIVVVVESAGSLVELGAFSQLPEFDEQLIAIISDEYAAQNSFISLGILRFIRDKNPSRVKSYPWRQLSPHEIDSDLISDVVADITADVELLEKSQVFNKNRRSHIIVLICEIVSIFSALKESEILVYLKQLEISVSLKEVARMLFLLEQFRLIRKARYSDAIFYLRTDIPHRRIRFAAKQNHTYDGLRARVQVKEFYKNDSRQKHRMRILGQGKTV